MQSLTNRGREVERKPMNIWEKMYIPAIAKGMAITFGHMFKKKPTINYPEQTRPYSPVFRGVQVLNRDEEGRERCTACGLCAVACPAEAITMEAAERLPEKKICTARKNMQPATKSICSVAFFCGLCEEACPKDAVYLSESMVPSNYNRKNFVYGKEELLIPDPKTNPEAYERAKGARVPTTANPTMSK